MRVTMARREAKRAPMTRWRSLIHQQRRLALLLVALAFSIKALVPAGYMVVPSAGKLVIAICTGQGAATVATDPGEDGGDHGDHHGDHRDGNKADHPCAFAGLGSPALAGADPILLALAIAFVLVAAFAPVSGPRQAARRRLRPPLRAPPVSG